MGETKKRVKKRKLKKDSLLGGSATGAERSFHKPKGDLGPRQRGKARLNDHRAQ
jgi:hypothetical protein